MTFDSQRNNNARSERYLYISGSEERRQKSSDFCRVTDTCTMLGVKDICISLGVKKKDKRAVTFWSDRYLYNARTPRERLMHCTTMLGVKDICISLGVKKKDKRAVTF